MRDEEKVTEANRRISPAENADDSTQLPEADDEVTRANRRMAREFDDTRDEPLTPDPAVQRSPD